MTFAYPGYEQYHHYDGHDLHGFDGGYGGSEGGEEDYGHHQIASQRIGHDHEHEHAHEYHHEEDEHVDYYVSFLHQPTQPVCIIKLFIAFVRFLRQITRTHITRSIAVLLAVMWIIIVAKNI